MLKCNSCIFTVDGDGIHDDTLTKWCHVLSLATPSFPYFPLPCSASSVYMARQSHSANLIIMCS